MADHRPRNNPDPSVKKSLFRDVEDISPLLWDDVLKLPLEKVARNSGATYEPGGKFSLNFMGGLYGLDMEKHVVEGPSEHLKVDFEKGMVLLIYLANAQDIGLSGRMVPGRDINGGAMFFTGPHALSTEPVTAKFADQPEALMAKAISLGATATPQNGEFSFEWLVLPNARLGVIFYPADDEFPADVIYTFDSYIQYHMPLDGIWGMVNVVARELAA